MKFLLSSLTHQLFFIHAGKVTILDECLNEITTCKEDTFEKVYKEEFSIITKRRFLNALITIHRQQLLTLI